MKNRNTNLPRDRYLLIHRIAIYFYYYIAFDIKIKGIATLIFYVARSSAILYY